jgi:hypothetical protein
MALNDGFGLSLNMFKSAETSELLVSDELELVYEDFISGSQTFNILG